jgi:hypothetical protein
MSEIEALKSLGAFPVVQAAVAIVVILAGVWMVFRGSRDKKPAMNGAPAWALYGPAHEVMVAIHEMNEQSRELNRILARVEEMLRGTGKAQWEACNALKRIEALTESMHRDSREQTMLLEDLRNNQVMRGDATQGIPRRR